MTMLGKIERLENRRLYVIRDLLTCTGCLSVSIRSGLNHNENALQRRELEEATVERTNQIM